MMFHHQTESGRNLRSDSVLFLFWRILYELFSKIFKKSGDNHNSDIEFTEEELSLINNIQCMNDKFNQLSKKISIYNHDSIYIQGIAGYFVSSKNYIMAEKLAKLAQEKAMNVKDLHYCNNLWIDLLYKQRDNQEKLNCCIEYCKKDIEIYPSFDKMNVSEYGNEEIHIPSFERLAIIYEKSGDLENAIKINELALSYPHIAKHDSYKKRLEKLKNKKKSAI